MRGVQHIVLPLFALLTAVGTVAAEEVGRPWGRVDAPSYRQHESVRSGYLGRYNPWEKNRDNGTDERPHYREQEQGPSAPYSWGDRSYYRGPGWQPGESYRPMMPGYEAGNYPSYAPTYSPYPVPAPWGGVLDPNYGNYWNDPYQGLQPNQGILWSDMWRR